MEKLIKLNSGQRINPEILEHNLLGKALIEEQILSRYFGAITGNTFDEDFLNFAYVKDNTKESFF